MFDRSILLAAGALLTAGFFVSSAGATAVNSVSFADGEVLNVEQIIGSGSNAAYLAIDFDSGANEAFEYRFNGATDGYTLLTAVAGTVNGVPSGPTPLVETDTYYASFGEHFVDSLADRSSSVQFPSLYFSPPNSADANNPFASFGTSAQGVDYEGAPYGVDDIVVGDGTIIAFDGGDLPVLPEVPEPATLGVLTMAGLFGVRRRR